MKKFKKTLAWVLSLAMVITMIPVFTVVSSAAGDPYQVGASTYGTFADALDAVDDTNDTIKLVADAIVTDLVVDKSCKLDLNGHILKAEGNTGTCSVIRVCNDTDTITFTLKDSNPTATHEGYPNGGIVTGGNLVMDTAGNNGGGMYIKNAEVTMEGGTIYGNSATSGGGVYIQRTKNEETSSFTMTGGTISYNSVSASSCGGGVYVNHGTFTMNGGSIENNNGGVSGGGVYVANGVNLEGGEYLIGGTFTFAGGTICGNTASMLGGGVYADGWKFDFVSGTICGNTASINGGGIYVAESSGSYIGGGTAVVKNNFKGTEENAPQNNVYLADDEIININVAPAAGSKIGVTTATAPTDGSPVEITSGWSYVMGESDPADYFFADDAGNYHVEKDGTTEEAVLSSGKTEICELVDSSNQPTANSPYSSIAAALDDVDETYNTVVMLADDMESVTVNNIEWTLDLNGHVLEAAYSEENTPVIYMDGHGAPVNFTLKDSRPEATHADSALPAGGVITGGTGYGYENEGAGGGICAYNVYFTMEGGNIYGNSATAFGGGVYVGRSDGADGLAYSFTMKGGAITNNKVEGARRGTHGGGVYVGAYNIGEAEFTMEGGIISENTAQEGGGVNVSYVISEMTGGTISENKAELQGGGVCNDCSSFNMTGGEITENTAFWGAGIISWGTLNLKDCSITGNTITGEGTHTVDFGGAGIDFYEGTITVSGQVIVKDNLSNGKQDNVFMEFDEEEETEYPVDNIPITIGEGGLTSGSSIGITHYMVPQEGSPIQITSGWSEQIQGSAPEEYFFADDSEHYNIDWNSGKTEGVLALGPTTHRHSWTYSTSGRTITATCGGTVGECDITPPVTVTIAAPTLATEGGEGSADAVLTYSDESAWNDADSGLLKPNVVYTGREGTDYESTTAPTAAGKYTATMKVGDAAILAEASVDYEIATAAPPEEEVEEGSNGLLSALAAGILFQTLKAWLTPILNLFMPQNTFFGLFGKTFFSMFRWF